MNPVLDRDYGVLCGVPRIKRIYYWGAWVEVVATDIGRANQPAPTGADACEQVERMPPGNPRAKEKMRRRPQRSLDERLQAVLDYHFGSASIKLLALRLHMPPEEVQAHVAANPELYEMFPAGRGSVRVRMRGR